VKLSSVPTVNTSSESYKVLWALSQEIREIMKREYGIGNEDSIIGINIGIREIPVIECR